MMEFLIIYMGTIITSYVLANRINHKMIEDALNEGYCYNIFNSQEPIDLLTKDTLINTIFLPIINIIFMLHYMVEYFRYDFFGYALENELLLQLTESEVESCKGINKFNTIKKVREKRIIEECINNPEINQINVWIKPIKSVAYYKSNNNKIEVVHITGPLAKKSKKKIYKSVTAALIINIFSDRQQLFYTDLNGQENIITTLLINGNILVIDLEGPVENDAKLIFKMNYDELQNYIQSHELIVSKTNQQESNSNSVYDTFEKIISFNHSNSKPKTRTRKKK